ncbi:MAG: PHB depolymerase family esterase [Bdellovibrionales bacterium]|nr:PHB depolymerase family esterase [Bdellovibrionales bacterium]
MLKRISHTNLLCLILTLLLSTNVFADWSQIDEEGQKGDVTFVYTPDQNRPPQSLVVLLHGCKQTAQDFIIGTQFEKIAQNENLILLAPEQSSAHNNFQCWNWFDNHQQTQNGSEVQRVIKVLDQTLAQFPSVKHVYVTGISAGAGLTSILINCYPEKFSAAAIHSGIKYKAAEGAIEAFQAMNFGTTKSAQYTMEKGLECSGSQKYVPTMILHGENDRVVNIKNAEAIVEHNKTQLDFFDDQEINQSYDFDSVDKTEIPHDETYSVNVTNYIKNKKPQISLVTIKGLDHAWSGGDEAPYSDPKGPNSTQLIWSFFKNY